MRFIIVLFFLLFSLNSYSAVIIKNEIPYGKSAMVGKGTTIIGLLCVENLFQRHIHIDYEVTIPMPLIPKVKSKDISIEKYEQQYLLKSSFKLSVEGEKWFKVIKIIVPSNAPAKRYPIWAKAIVKSKKGESTVESINYIRVVSDKEIKRYFQIEEILLPTNEKGEIELRQKKNTFLIKGKNRLWHRIVLKEDKKIGIEPATYMSVIIRNNASYKATLLVKVEILDPKSGKKVKGFEYPYAAEHGDLLTEGEIYKIVCIQPKSKKKVILPIYTNENVVLPGIYIARVKVFFFGTNTMVEQMDIKIKAVSNRILPILVTLTAVVITVISCIFFYAKRKKFLSIGTRNLLLISLFGTTMFTVIDIPGTIVFNLANVLLGPFSFLITGFFYEIIFYLLLTCLIVLIPKTGVISLVVMIEFLMSSFILGEFSPLSLIYYPTMAMVLEIATYLVGFTKRNILCLATALGIADVFIGFIFFNLAMLFYRLYYADWYIGLYLIVNGFIFTFLAVPFGFKLGEKLKKISVV